MTDGIVNWVMAGGIVTISTFSIGTYIYVGKSVNKVKEEMDKKIERNYLRLDEIKHNIENGFTRKDVCVILHEQISSDLTDIKADLKILLRHNGLNNEGKA